MTLIFVYIYIYKGIIITCTLSKNYGKKKIFHITLHLFQFTFVQDCNFNSLR